MHDTFVGRVIIFSASSGSGKTTIARHLVQHFSQLAFSISACTRDKRGRTEVHGKDYYFFSRKEFIKKIDEGAFIEWEEVYKGAYYGTLASEIERIWSNQQHAVLDVDVKGGMKLKQYYKERALAVFVKVPSIDELRKRLKSRNTETDADIETRLAKVQYENSFESNFDVTILNDNLDMAIQEASRIVEDFINYGKIPSRTQK